MHPRRPPRKILAGRLRAAQQQRSDKRHFRRAGFQIAKFAGITETLFIFGDAVAKPADRTQKVAFHRVGRAVLVPLVPSGPSPSALLVS